MTDLASFYTTQNSTAITADAAGAKNDAPQQGGFGIFDLLLAQIEEQIANGDAFADGAAEDTKATFDENNKANLISILASNDGVAEDVAALDDILDLDLLAEIEQTLALNQKIFDDALKAGTGNDDLLIDKETGEIIVPDVAKTLNLLEISSSDINEILENVDLSTLNLTPQQVTLVQDIQQGVVPTEAQADEIQDILATVLNAAVAIVPPANGAIKKGVEPANENAARFNPSTPAGLGGESGLDGQLDGEFDPALLASKGKKYAGNPTGENTPNTPNGNNNNAPTNQAGPAFSALQALPLAADGSLLSASGFSDQLAEQLGLSLNGSHNSTQGSLTALVSQAQSGSAPHPATQMVAATINKVGIGGQDTNISLRLDPAELGRVDVNLTFSKDKHVKAVVTIEKPETFMMLQRDAQVLERALQDAGLDSNGGLSFELAQDGNFMDNNNQRGGGHDHGGTGRGGDNGEELEIIESTMTWRVDAETGHTRYDIYA